MRRSITPGIGPVGAQLIAWMFTNTSSHSASLTDTIDNRWYALQQSIAGMLCLFEHFLTVGPNNRITVWYAR
jgi:hypothetical protein